MIARFRLIRLSCWVVLLALPLAMGCTRAKAKTVPDIPALEVPPAPPRDAEPTESEPPPPVSLPQEPARNAPPRPRPATPTREQQPPQTPRPEAPKPEPPVVSETTPPPNEEPPRPPATLQTTPPSAEADLERTIRAMLTRAANDLNRIDYRILNTEARQQYDTAKSFIRQAENAIRAKNLVFAKSVAEKAATLAAQLGGK